jgi:hypothetical protein
MEKITVKKAGYFPQHIYLKLLFPKEGSQKHPIFTSPHIHVGK